MAPWWWFPCKPKHVGVSSLFLRCFNNSTFFNVVCISWKIKCWILLMHGVTMKLIMSVWCSWISEDCIIVNEYSGEVLCLTVIQILLFWRNTTFYNIKCVNMGGNIKKNREKPPCFRIGSNKRPFVLRKVRHILEWKDITLPVITNSKWLNKFSFRADLLKWVNNRL